MPITTRSPARCNVTNILNSTRHATAFRSYTSNIKRKPPIITQPTAFPHRSFSSPSSRKVKIFLPHEQLDLKATLKSTSSSAPNTNAKTTRSSITSAHHDLPSYLSHHSARLSLLTDPTLRHKLLTSTVHLGTRYEYLIHSHLSTHLSFSLTRVGGKGDGGVDLIGTWTLPEPASVSVNRRSFRVLCQAKRLGVNRKPGPALMRELEGTVASATIGGGMGQGRVLAEAFVAHGLRKGGVPRSEVGAGLDSDADADLDGEKADLSHLPTLGILTTTRPLTDGIEKAMASSRRPLMYMCLEELSTSQAGEEYSEATAMEVPKVALRQMAWNSAASLMGLGGYDVARKYADNHSARSKTATLSGLDGEASLVFNGRPVHFPIIT